MEANESQRRLVLVVGCALVLGLIVSRNFPFLGQTAPERFWLAGRYDGNQIIVYFDAVKFGETVPKDAVKIHYPIADSFFSPVGLPPDYVARFQQKPGAEHFSIGDRYGRTDHGANEGCGHAGGLTATGGEDFADLNCATFHDWGRKHPLLYLGGLAIRAGGGLPIDRPSCGMAGTGAGTSFSCCRTARLPRRSAEGEST